MCVKCTWNNLSVLIYYLSHLIIFICIYMFKIKKIYKVPLESQLRINIY